MTYSNCFPKYCELSPCKSLLDGPLSNQYMYKVSSVCQEYYHEYLKTLSLFCKIQLSNIVFLFAFYLIHGNY